jgi:hypothetical protein
MMQVCCLSIVKETPVSGGIKSQPIACSKCPERKVEREGTYEELADVVGTLRSETLGDSGVSKTGKVLLTLLDDGDGEDRHVGGDDASTDGLALALTGAAGAVARVTLGQQEADTGGEEDTLLHGETLLVVTSGDAEDVTLELVTERVDSDLSGDTLVVEDTARKMGEVV